MIIRMFKRVCYPDSNSMEPKYKAKLLEIFSSDSIPRKGEVIIGIDNEAYDVVEVIHHVCKTRSSSVFIEVTPHNYYEEANTNTAYSLITELERDTN